MKNLNPESDLWYILLNRALCRLHSNHFRARKINCLGKKEIFLVVKPTDDRLNVGDRQTY